jgi:hypothetical protein
MKPALALLALTLAVAETKPDFSGTWKQNSSRSSFAGMAAPISVTDIITHKDPDLHLTQTVVGPQGDSITSEHDFFTDGRESAGKSRNYTEKNTVKWEGNALVVSRRDYGGREVALRERWTLSTDGKTLVKDRVSPSRNGEVKQTFVLEKQ